MRGGGRGAACGAGGPGVDRAAVLAATDYLLPVIEIIDSRVRNEVKPESVQLSIDAKGQIYWNSTAIDLATFDKDAEEATRR